MIFNFQFILALIIYFLELSQSNYYGYYGSQYNTSINQYYSRYSKSNDALLVFAIIAGIVTIALDLLSVFKHNKFTKIVSGCHGFGVLATLGCILALLVTFYDIIPFNTNLVICVLTIVPGIAGFIIGYININAGKIMASINFGFTIGATITGFFPYILALAIILCLFSLLCSFLFQRFQPDLSFKVSCSFVGAQSIFQTIADLASISYLNINSNYNSNLNSSTVQKVGMLAGSIILTIIGVIFQNKHEKYLINKNDAEKATETDFKYK